MASRRVGKDLRFAVSYPGGSLTDQISCLGMGVWGEQDDGDE